MTTTILDEPTVLETRFGTFDAQARDVIHFTSGVPGFESCTRFVLLNAAALSPFNCLQGLDGAKPSFLVIDPRLVQPAYEARLNEAEYRRLEATPRDPLAWLVIVRVGPAEEAVVNLRAPIVVNPGRMLGIQALPHESEYRHDHPLRLEPTRAGLHA